MSSRLLQAALFVSTLSMLHRVSDTQCAVQNVTGTTLSRTISADCNSWARRFVLTGVSSRLLADLRSGQLAGNNFCKIYEGSDDEGKLVGTLEGGGFSLPVIVESSSAYVSCVTNLTSESVRFYLHPITCGEDVADIPYNLLSPRFPNSYPNAVVCVWRFQMNSSTTLAFQFSTFSTENCCDILYFKDEEGKLDKFSGGHGSFTHMVTATNLTVVFVSDGSVRSTGFNARVVSETQCAVQNVSGNFHGATISADCNSWALRFVSTGVSSRLIAHFRSGPLAENNFCKIYEGSDDQGKLAGTLEGGGLSFPVIVESSSAYISCVTNLTSESVSFYLHPFTSCGEDVEDIPYNLLSPTFPSNYPNYAGCVWRFQMNSSRTLMFQFSTFYTKAYFDMLYFKNEEGNVDKLSGSLGSFDYTVTATNVTVVFVSDGSERRKGFNATVVSDTQCAVYNVTGNSLDAWINNCDIWSRRFVSTGVSARFIAYLGSGQLAANNFCEIYEGSDDQGKLAGTLEGGGLSFPVIVESSSAYISCLTNLTSEFVLFRLNSFTSCGENVADIPYNLLSPRFPSNYPNFAGCVWKFQMNRSKSLMFQFSTFNTQSYYDVLYFKNEEGIVAKFSGSLGSFDYTVTATNLTVMFVSDPSRSRAGFNATVEIQPTVECRTANLIIRVTAYQQNRLDYELNDTLYIALDRETSLSQLNDSCKVTGSNPVFTFDIGQCKGAFKNENGTVSVSFLIWRYLAPSPAVIQRDVQNKLNVTCLFDADLLISSSKISTQIGFDEIFAKKAGTLDVALNLFSNEHFNEILPRDVTVPNYIFAKLKLDEISAADDYFIVQLEGCWATRNENSDSLPSYQIVQSGCVAPPSGSDTANAKILIRNYQSNFATFKLMSFVWTNFTDAEQFIYIHCDVTVCHNSTGQCPEQTCSGKKRRSVGDNGRNQLLSAGPVHIIQGERNEAIEGAGNSYQLVMFVLLAVIIIGAGYIVWGKLTRDRNARQIRQ